MGHGELTGDVYGQVWHECYDELLYLPHLQRFTRAQIASKKERIESLEDALKMNTEEHMARMVRRLTKKEKRLKILLGGYQSRAAAMDKQIAELADQIDKAEMSVAGALGQQQRESLAIDVRLKVALTEIANDSVLQKLRDEVDVQRERETDLQKRYDAMKLRLNQARTRRAATTAAQPVIY